MIEERIVAAPHWEWWITLYFFLGGIASGAYFIGTMIDLFGRERDRPIAKAAYMIAFPLVVLCGIFLIVDLGRPERFWHMLIQNNTFRPMFKYWSPMSVGSWGLSAFGAFSFASFVGALAEDNHFGLGRFGKLASYLHRGPVGVVFQVLGTLSGFFLAAYTGALLTATNQPVWSDSSWIAALFLASAASTGIAALYLVLALWGHSSHRDLVNLERTDLWAMGLEGALLVIFFISLGSLAVPLLASPYGLLMVFGTGLLGIILPVILIARPTLLGRNSHIAAAVLVLIGGFILRYAMVFAGERLAVAGI